MNKSKDLNRYIDLYRDFLHPNPNINSKAIISLRNDFRHEFLKDLLTNLKKKRYSYKKKINTSFGGIWRRSFQLISTFIL